MMRRDVIRHLRRRLLQPAPHVRYDADNARARRLACWIPDEQTHADRITTAPNALRQGLVDHGNRRRSRAIISGLDLTTLQQPYSHRAEIALRCRNKRGPAATTWDRVGPRRIH